MTADIACSRLNTNHTGSTDVIVDQLLKNEFCSQTDFGTVGQQTAQIQPFRSSIQSCQLVHTDCKGRYLIQDDIIYDLGFASYITLFPPPPNMFCTITWEY